MKSFCFAMLLMVGLLGSGLAHADGFCPPGYYDPNNGRAPAVTCAPMAGGGQQQASQQPAERWESRWGAIATDGSKGAMGVATDKRSKREASKTAMQDCQSKGGVNCTVDIPYHDGCAAVVVGNGGYNATADATVDQAAATGMKTCRDAGRSNCRVYYSACSLPVRVQ